MFLTFTMLAGWIIFGAICSQIAAKKGRDKLTWFFLGFFLGIFGLVIILCLKTLKAEETPIIVENPLLADLRRKHWYFLEGSKQLGPMSFDAFRHAYRKGDVTHSHYVWNEDMKDWKPLKELPDTHDLLEE